MRHLPGCLDRNGQSPDKIRRVVALLGPEYPDQACKAGERCCKGNTHAQDDHDQHESGNDETDIDGFHQPVSPSSKPETVFASLAACVAASSISGTATGVDVPDRNART